MSRLLILLSLAPSIAFAADAVAGSGDDRLFEQLLGGDVPIEPSERGRTDVPDPPSAEPPAVEDEAVGRISADLAEAGRLLSERQTGEPTRGAQRRVIEELNRLIGAAKNQPSSSSGSQSDSTGSGSSNPQPGGEASPAPGADGGDRAAREQRNPQGSPGRNREGKAEESSDRARDAEVHDAVRGYRSDIVRDAWGHLPPRLREQLLNAGSDRTLPEYDGLVRRYFESIARPPAPEPGR